MGTEVQTGGEKFHAVSTECLREVLRWATGAVREGLLTELERRRAVEPVARTPGEADWRDR